MAKTRRSTKPSPGKKKSASSRGKPAKAAKKKVARRAPRPARPQEVLAPVQSRIELKKLRRDFELVLTVLSGKVGSTPEVTSKLDDTRRRVSQWMTDIDDICSPELQEICGPDMVFPLP